MKPDTSKISCDFVNELLNASLIIHVRLLLELSHYLLYFGSDEEVFSSTFLTFETDEWVNTLSKSGLINIIAWLIEKIDLMEKELGMR